MGARGVGAVEGVEVDSGNVVIQEIVPTCPTFTTEPGSACHCFSGGWLDRNSPFNILRVFIPSLLLKFDAS